MSKKKNSTRAHLMCEVSNDHLSPEIKKGDRVMYPARLRSVRSRLVPNGCLAVVETKKGEGFLRRVWRAGKYVLLEANKGGPVVLKAAEVKGVSPVCALFRGKKYVRPYHDCDGRAVAEGEGPKEKRRDASDGRRLKELRRRLEKLDEEDEQIIRCSERYKLEKEIYDIEHPTDTNDWSAWQE